MNTLQGFAYIQDRLITYESFNNWYLTKANQNLRKIHLRVLLNAFRICLRGIWQPEAFTDTFLSRNEVNKERRAKSLPPIYSDWY